MVEIVLENTNVGRVVAVYRSGQVIQCCGRSYAPTPDTRFSISSVRVDGVSHSAVADAIRVAQILEEDEVFRGGLKPLGDPKHRQHFDGRS